MSMIMNPMSMKQINYILLLVFVLHSHDGSSDTYNTGWTTFGQRTARSDEKTCTDNTTDGNHLHMAPFETTFERAIFRHDNSSIRARRDARRSMALLSIVDGSSFLDTHSCYYAKKMAKETDRSMKEMSAFIRRYAADHLRAIYGNTAGARSSQTYTPAIRVSAVSRTLAAR
jgi:hypothetical protein